MKLIKWTEQYVEIKCQLDATEVFIADLIASLLHLVGILFPHISDDARSKSHQIWTEQVQDRLKWKGIVEKAKTLSEL